MKGSLVAALALAGFTLAEAPLLAQRGGEREAAKNGWLSSLAEGQKLARKTGKPLMVVLRCVP